MTLSSALAAGGSDFTKAWASFTANLDMDDPESTLHTKRELTSAGQNGSELSGGQQARVALARCIYAALVGSDSCGIIFWWDDTLELIDDMDGESSLLLIFHTESLPQC